MICAVWGLLGLGFMVGLGFGWLGWWVLTFGFSFWVYGFDVFWLFGCGGVVLFGVSVGVVDLI